MARLTIGQVAAAAFQAGFRGQALAEITAIAMAESGGNARALNPRGEHSVGLTQINMRAHGTRFGTEAQLYNPVHNMRAAFALSNGGRNFRPWSVHRSSPSPHAGASNRFLSAARQAAARVSTASPDERQAWLGSHPVGGPGDTRAPQARFDNMPGTGPAFDQAALQEAQRAEEHRQLVLRVMGAVREQADRQRRAGARQMPMMSAVPGDAFDVGPTRQRMERAVAGDLTPAVARSAAPPRGRARRVEQLTGLRLPAAESARKRREEEEALLRGMSG